MRVNQSAGQQWRAPQWPRWLSAFHCWHRLTPAGALLSSPQSDKFPCAKRAFLSFFFPARPFKGFKMRPAICSLSTQSSRSSFTTPVLCCLVKCTRMDRARLLLCMHRGEAISGKRLENFWICAFVSKHKHINPWWNGGGENNAQYFIVFKG